MIIHCTDNIAYSVEVPKNLRTTLLQAGLDVKPVVNVPGPHFACVTHPDRFVPLRNFRRFRADMLL